MYLWPRYIIYNRIVNSVIWSICIQIDFIELYGLELIYLQKNNNRPIWFCASYYSYSEYFPAFSYLKNIKAFFTSLLHKFYDFVCIILFIDANFWSYFNMYPINNKFIRIAQWCFMKNCAYSVSSYWTRQRSCK